MRFHDRRDAGRQLAAEVARLELDDPIVLALPRGGVPVGFEVAEALDAPLHVFVSRKIGAPGHPEFGIGAIAEGGEPLFDASTVQALGVTQRTLAGLVDAERREVARRVDHYRGGRPLPSVSGRVVVVIDDGLATGVTAEAALRALRGSDVGRLVLAVPVCAPDTAGRLAPLVDDIVCVWRPDDFRAVGQWYDVFDQTSDAQVLELLSSAASAAGHGREAPG